MTVFSSAISERKNAFEDGEYIISNNLNFRV